MSDRSLCWASGKWVPALTVRLTASAYRMSSKQSWVILSPKIGAE